jgi:hypothetical protein
MSTPESLVYLECTSRDANNAYAWIGGGSRLDAFREALEDLRTRSFPNFTATGTISCLSVELPFSLQDTVQTLNERFIAELDDIARAYGDDV